MVAELSQKILNASFSTSIQRHCEYQCSCRSLGYIPPEYAYTMQVTAPGNVYNYGAVLLGSLLPDYRLMRLWRRNRFGEVGSQCSSKSGNTRADTGCKA
ncbi:hypothetical protein CK203_012358 [Vitis vinifera]|uniref:Uncharacterized protein n=1 Tax=Vitis vinifera TaxID=29760 RepID=A0A438JKQ7_VITVI|nr:hypothetical protein CK203_012358 [Vitis vinifera]